MDLLCCDHVTECSPPGSAGVPPAHVLAQPWRSPPPGSTGNCARTLLQPGPCRSRRQGGRVPHRRETERHDTAVHAGGTPALPGGPPPIALAARGGRRRLAGPQPCPCGRAVTLGRPFVSMGIENCRVLGTESGRMGPLPCGGSEAQAQHTPRRLHIRQREAVFASVGRCCNAIVYSPNF